MGQGNVISSRISVVVSGAEVLLSKKTMSLSTEELLATLQGQVQTLTLQNKELQEKIQVTRHFPTSAGVSLRPSLLHHSQQQLRVNPGGDLGPWGCSRLEAYTCFPSPVRNKAMCVWILASSLLALAGTSASASTPSPPPPSLWSAHDPVATTAPHAMAPAALPFPMPVPTCLVSLCCISANTPSNSRSCISRGSQT